jgi:VWFA-related protein
MHRWSMVALLAFAALPCWAAKRVSVEQLERTLAALAHRSDAETARQIGTLEPAERISDPTLERLSGQYAHGPLTSVALQLFADRSSFLDLPPSELPAVPPPDTATQTRQLEGAHSFAMEALPRLPNLFATRTIYSFDDSLQEVKKGGWLEQAGLHLVETAKVEVSVRSEQENVSGGSRPGSQQQNGLVTWGEFGSALLLILSDSAHGTTAWSHWEQSGGGLISVFRYDVPQSASHYEIGAPAEQVTHLGGSGRWMGYGASLSNDHSASQMVVIRPGYHGSLWIDPGSGTILRVSLIADLKGSSNLEHAAILVEYGPVRIGGQSFVCPVRSLAFSDAPANVSTTIDGATTEWLNENLFTHYHLFHASSRIVGETAADTEPETVPEAASATPGPAASQPLEANATSTTLQIVPPEPHSATSPPPPVEQHPSAPPAQAAPLGESASVAPEPAAPEPQPREATASGAQPAPGAAPSIPAVPVQPSGAGGRLTLHVNVNAVLVPVVVRDDQGHSIDDLQRQDFEAFDDGKPRPLSGFLVEMRGVPRKAAQGIAIPAASPSPSAAAPSAMALPDRVTVFVFDDLHLTAEQIAYSQKAAIRTLDEALAGSDVAAVVTTSGNINSGLTRDPSRLSSAVMAVRPQTLGRAETSACPKISYYQADLIVNKHNDAALQDAIQQVMTVCSGKLPPSMLPMATSIANSTARRVLRGGEQDVLTTYATISELVRRMARLPGEHIMILVSPGFLPIEEEARTEESRLINLAAQSSVTINALDARGLYTTAITASENLGGRNPVQMMEYRENAMSGSGNAMGELAEATGGAFFHNNNDLAEGFRGLLEAPGTVYVLELPLEGMKEDGAWHRLSVKVDRGGTHIQARQGYFAPAESAGH